MLDSVGQVVAAVDLQGRITYWNRCAQSLYGWSQEETLGRNLIELLGMPVSGRDVMKRLENNETWSGEIVAKRRDGSSVMLETSTSAIRDDQGKLIGVIGVSSDIAERKKAEQELREREAELSTILASVPILTLVLDADTRVIKANAAAAKFAGRTVEEMVGLRGGEALRCLHSLNDPRGCGFGPYCQTCKTRLTVLDALRTGSSHYQVEWRLSVSREGKQEEVAYLLSTIPLATSKKQVLVAIEDVTERKKTEEEIGQLNQSLLQRAAELEAANKELEAFSYSVSHDLRAPLRSLEGFSQALLEEYADKLSGEGQDFLRRIQQSSVLMAKLIDDLLKLSRMTRSEMRREPVDLSAMAQEIMADLSEQDIKRSVKFTLTPAMVVDGDSQLLRLALDNLLGNAWKFTGNVAEAKIEMGVTEQDGTKAYFVRDNGAGFDMAYADNLFAPFRRLHKASEFPGTGIGLASVQRVIRRHGGRVWAEAKVGQGATFYFTLGR